MSFTIVIPSRSDSNVVACIAAVRAAGEDANVVVIDDGLKIPHGNVCQVGKKPFIFSRACNQGIALSWPDDVILLNDDALLETPGGFTALSEAAAEHTEYGVIAAACNNTGNQRQRQQPGGRLRSEPRMVCFTCVYIPRATINRVGLLDERFVAYGFEDDDYCVRVRGAGLNLGIFDGCLVNHEKLPSTFRAAGPQSLDPGRAIFMNKWGCMR